MLGRDRAVSLFFVALFVLSALGVMATPMAGAAQPAVAITSVRLYVGGVESTSGSPIPAGGDTQFTVTVTGTLTVGSSDCGANQDPQQRGWLPNVTVTADFSSFGGAARTNVAITQSDGAAVGANQDSANSLFRTSGSNTAKTYSIVASQAFTATGGSVDDVPTAITATMWSSCKEGLSSAPGTPNTDTKTSTDQILLDNKPPVITSSLVATSANQGGIGAGYSVTLSTTSTDFASLNVNLGQFTSGLSLVGQTNLATLSTALQNKVVSETGFDAPLYFINASDTLGNVARLDNLVGTGATFDARAPTVSASAVKVTPQSDGGLVVAFTGNKVGDVTKYAVNLTNLNDSTVQQFFVTHAGAATAAQSLAIPATSLASFTPYRASVSAMDAAGNFGPTTTPTDAAAAYTEIPPIDVTIQTTPTSPGNAFPALSGTWAGHSIHAGTAENITVALKRDSDGKYWNAAAGDFTSATRYELPVTAVVGASPAVGTWSLNNFSAANAKVASGSSGAFTFEVVAKDPTHDLATAVKTAAFTVDKGVPALAAFKADANQESNAFVAGGPLSYQQGVSSFTMALNATSSSGFKTAKYTLVDAGQVKVLRPGTTTPYTVTCPAQCTMTPGFDLAHTTYNGVVSFVATDLPVNQSYRWNLTITNGVDTPSTPERFIDQAFVVGPRVAIDALANKPTVNDAGQVFAHPLGAWDNAQTYDGRSTCDASHVCGVTDIQMFVRASSDTSDGTAIGAPVYLPISSAQGYDPANPSNAAAPKYYDYYNGPFTLPTGIDKNFALVRAKAHVQLGDGAIIEAVSDWVSITPTSNPASLVILQPATNYTTVVMDGTPGTVSFSVRLDRPGLVLSPKINYTLVNNATGVAVPVFTPAGLTVPASTPAGNNTMWATETAASGSTYYFNFTNAATIPQGEYYLNVSAVVNDTYVPLQAYGFRWFGVASQAPTVTLSSVAAPASYGWPATEVFQGKFVRPVFNLTLAVDSDVANMTQAGLQANLEKNDASNPYLPTGTGASAYQATLKGFQQLTATRWLAWYEVHLPANAQDGGLFVFRVNATSTAPAPTDTTLNRSSSNIVIQLDSSPPAPTLLAPESGATLNTTELRLIGSVEDLMSGTSKVEVNLYDVTTGKTFVWNQNLYGVWVNGDVNGSYMSSDLLQGGVNGVPVGDRYVKNVFVTANRTGTNAEVAIWTLNDSIRPRYTASGGPYTADGGVPYPPLSLDPGHTYRVRVRATDRVGLVGESESLFHFDRVGPTFAGPFAFANTTINAAGDSFVNVYAQDNWCVGRVVIEGTAPVSGANASADFPMPARAKCPDSFVNRGLSQYDGYNGNNTWTLNLQNAPQLRSEVGTWNYTVRIFDTAGNNVSSSVWRVYVRDNVAPATTLALQPATIGVGTSARAVASVVENNAVASVTARVKTAAGQVLGQGAMSADPNHALAANGTGTYILDLASLNLTLDIGNYTVEAWGVDANGTVGAVGPATLRVVAEAAPDIRFDRPADDATFLGAEPTFSFRVSGKGLSASGVVVKAGSGNLTTVSNVTYAFAPGTNNTVLQGSFAPGNLSAFNTYAVSVDVTTASGFQSSALHNYTIDTLAPSVSASLSANATVNGVSWARPGATVSLLGSDAGSGIASITYSTSTRGPTTYSAPIAIPAVDGLFTVDYAATDNAGNVQRGRFEVNVDTSAPTLSVIQSGLSVNVTVNDHNGVGVNDNQTVLHYLFGTASTFATKAMTRVPGTSIFSATVTGDLANGMSFYVTAQDLLGNVATNGSAGSPNVIAPPGGEGGNGGGNGTTNTPPTVTLLRPTAGESVRGTTVIQYVATDAETPASLLKVTISLRAPDGTGSNLVADGPNSGNYTLNTAALTAGTYTLVVRVTDGEKPAVAQVQFAVAADKPITPDPSAPLPANADAGTAIPFAVKIQPAGKTVAQATYTVLKDGAPFATGVLQASGGKYTASFTPTAAGSYAVKVQAAYTDGSSDATPTDVGTVAVAQAAPPDKGPGGPPVSFLVLVVLAAATVALAGYGAFVRWKK